MELEFETGTEENPVRIRINSEGEMLFPEGVLEFDQTMEALGGDRSKNIVLSEQWEKDPIDVLFWNIFGVPSIVKCWLLVECAERAFPILEKSFTEKDLRPLWQCLAQTRATLLDEESIENEITNITKNVSKLGDLRQKVDRFISLSVSGQANAGLIPYATIHATAAVWAAAAIITQGITYAGSTRLAIAFDVFQNMSQPVDEMLKSAQHSQVWQEAYRAEELWEINRFLELMSVITDLALDKITRPEK